MTPFRPNSTVASLACASSARQSTRRRTPSSTGAHALRSVAVLVCALSGTAVSARPALALGEDGRSYLTSGQSRTIYSCGWGGTSTIEIAWAVDPAGGG